MRQVNSRWLVCCIGVSALLLPGLSLAQGTSTSISASPSAEVAEGGTVSVSIVVDQVTDLRAIEINLAYDPGLLEVVDANPSSSGIQLALGPFLSPDSVSQNQVDQDFGLVSFGYSSEAPSTPVSGGGTVATITFRGRAGGLSPLVFLETSLIGEAGAPIEHTTQSGHVAVYPAAAAAATPTPTPETSPLETPTQTTTPDPTETATPTPTTTPDATATATPTPTSSPTPDSTAAPTTAPTATPTGTPAATCDQILGEHVVRSGETLYSIGRAYGVKPSYIALCNSIVNPNLIRPDTTLKIPDAKWFPIPQGPTAQRQFGDAPPTPTCSTTHTVLRGQNLFRISLHYSKSMWAIAEANSIYNLSYILAGQVLCIP